MSLKRKSTMTDSKMKTKEEENVPVKSWVDDSDWS
jgi:hypothetical protein